MKLDMRWNGIACGGQRGDRWLVLWWHPLPARRRFWGYRKGWSNGPVSRFGWWSGDMVWRLPWTHHDGGIRTNGWFLNHAWQRRSNR
ncbi:hypothetical protein [Methylobacterium durans]|uniref:hypothetical protein n=1 Tax=Methylobacterium durans TaxID=2202825 RepID=UPI0013A56940|nr:hypothetical protein [Methylobacterium durans]